MPAGKKKAARKKAARKRAISVSTAGNGDSCQRHVNRGAPATEEALERASVFSVPLAIELLKRGAPATKKALETASVFSAPLANIIILTRRLSSIDLASIIISFAA